MKQMLNKTEQWHKVSQHIKPQRKWTTDQDRPEHALNRPLLLIVQSKAAKTDLMQA